MLPGISWVQVLTVIRGISTTVKAGLQLLHNLEGFQATYVPSLLTGNPNSYNPYCVRCSG